jgi:hypothetical protein
LALSRVEHSSYIQVLLAILMGFVLFLPPWQLQESSEEPIPSHNSNQESSNPETLVWVQQFFWP